MYGLIFAILEEWIIETQEGGLTTWHAIKKQAGCEVEDQGFLRRSYYPDSDMVQLVVAASDRLGLLVPEILQAFGHAFGAYVMKYHYGMVRCQGSTFRQWFSNLNAMHDHIQKSFPGQQFAAPVFWCEDCETCPGSILLHYFSQRGTLLVPFVEGVVEKLALSHFQVPVQLEQLALQKDESAFSSSPFTTWRITAIDPDQAWKVSPLFLTPQEEGQLQTPEGDPHEVDHTEETSRRRFSTKKLRTSMTCPFSGTSFMGAPVPASTLPSHPTTMSEKDDEDDDEENDDDDDDDDDVKEFLKDLDQPTGKQPTTEGMSLAMMKEIFPFHILVRRDFSIVQVGEILPRMLENDDHDFEGKHIEDIVDITRPVMGSSWDWKALHKLSDQQFFLSPKNHNTKATVQQKVSMMHSHIRFKGAMVGVSNDLVMFVLMPDAHNVFGLQDMGLTMSDLPLVSCQRDNVFLGEYISQEAKAAHSLDKLSKRLDNEKNLSNTLLSKMLPKQVAEELRAGKTVEPKLYENVTLFFSDIEGFTSICDKVDPWDIIDMLNQLYGVMDHLAEHFHLYKVETIGDAYMCCSGLPVPDNYHAENIANFALAVVECVKHIKSPVDNVTPLRLRVGIHTGSCTAGVVGTLTPHYCLFGDMVNTTSRHESTGVAGQIQVSSLLFGRLKHFSMYGEDRPQYNFTPRGLVNMKGKGDCYTYWLDGGTEHNRGAGTNQLMALSREIGDMMKNKQFSRRTYFRRSGDLRTDAVSEVGSTSTYTTNTSESMSLGMDGKSNAAAGDIADGANGDSSVQKAEQNFVIKDSKDIFDDITSHHSRFKSNDADGSSSVSDDEKMELDEQELDEMIVEQEKVHGRPQTLDQLDSEDNSTPLSDLEPHAETWSDLGKEATLPTEDLVTKMHGLLSTLLKQCLEDDDVRNLELITSQLYGYIHRISTLNPKENRFHTFRRACHTVQTADYLWRKASQCHQGSYEHESIDWNPWNRFILIFAALVHNVKHSGKSNEQLEQQNHLTHQIHGNGRKSCQQRSAAHSALSILADEFPELYEEIMFACPMQFFHVARKLILATDLESKEVTNKRTRVLEKVMENNFNSSGRSRKRDIIEKTEVVLEHIISMSIIGHYAQDHDVFLEWSRAEFQENLDATNGNQRETWHEDRIFYFNQVVLPMADRMELIIPPSYCNLRTYVERNLTFWQEEAPFKVTYMPMTETVTQETLASESAILENVIPYDRKLVDSAVELLLKPLKRIIASNGGIAFSNELNIDDIHGQITTTTPYEEVRMMILIKPIPKTVTKNGKIDIELPPGTKEELEDYVIKIASAYSAQTTGLRTKHDFHNFEHATNVAYLVHLLLKRIQKATRHDHDGIDSSLAIGLDPLVHFSAVFAALVHDFGHPGIPNEQLGKENPSLAKRYSNKSIAKQQSIDTAWDLLTHGRYKNLRKCIYGTLEECQRFRHLLVNCVMATDNFDKDLDALRQSRFDSCFGDEQRSDQDNVHYQATSVIELVLQTANIAHTMQQWPVYTTWNDKLFLERFAAYAASRSVEDPSDSWYNDELWFFDNKVIPLASKLLHCGVFGPSGDEFLNYAKKNRSKWEAEGMKVCRKMIRRARRRYPVPTASTT